MKRYLIFFLLCIFSINSFSQNRGTKEHWVFITDFNGIKEYIWSKHLEKRGKGIFKIWIKRLITDKGTISPFLDGNNYDLITMKCLVLIDISKTRYKILESYFYDENENEITIKDYNFILKENKIEWQEALPESSIYNLIKKAANLFNYIQ